MSLFYKLKVYSSDSQNKIFVPINLEVYKRGFIFELWCEIKNKYLFLKFFSHEKEINKYILFFSKLCMRNKLIYATCCLHKQFLPREKCYFCSKNLDTFYLNKIN